MRYNGGKFSCSKELAQILNSYCSPNKVYWEPFVGAANVIEKISATKRIGSDKDLAIISLLKAVQKGWEPPYAVTEQQYKDIRDKGNLEDPIYAFAKYGCSFGGKPWGGYARSGTRNYALNARNSLLKQKKYLSDVLFMCTDYTADIKADIVYCDPPYKDTTVVGCCEKFDSDSFWEWVREKSKTAKVFVSEQVAPSDFICVWEKKLTDGLGNKKITERLFTLA